MTTVATLYVYYNAVIGNQGVFKWSTPTYKSGTDSYSSDFIIDGSTGKLTLTGLAGNFTVKGVKFVTSRSGNDTAVEWYATFNGSRQFFGGTPIVYVGYDESNITYPRVEPGQSIYIYQNTNQNIEWYHNDPTFVVYRHSSDAPLNTTVTQHNIAGGGDHTAVIKLSNSTVRTSGYNGFGQLGNGTTTDRLTSVQVQNISTAVAVACGSTHTAVVLSNGTVMTFGWNSSGQLGLGYWSGDLYESLTPVQVPGISTAVSVSCGTLHTAVLLSDGTVRTFGNNASGQLGDGTTTSKNTPVQVSGISSVVSLACGNLFNAFVLSNGSVWTCGNNTFGQLGDGTTVDKSTPVKVLNISTAVAVACGSTHTAVLLSNSTVMTFGNNNDNQLGNYYIPLGGFSSTPVQYSSITTVTSVACGEKYTSVQFSTRSVNTRGIDPGNDYSGILTTSFADDVLSIASGENHIIFRQAEKIRTRGKNQYGQLGDGTTTNVGVIQTVFIMNDPFKSMGSLSFDLDIAPYFGGSRPHSLSEYYSVAIGMPTSGQAISFSNFYGKSK